MKLQEMFPHQEYKGGGYVIVNDGTHGASIALKINAIQFGVASGLGQGPVISGEDAFFLDTKYDDGVPINGSIRALDGGFTTDCVNTGAYQVGPNNKEGVCLVRFLLF